jgi:uroporphyrinogen-III synthase
MGLLEMMEKQKPAGKSIIIPRSSASNEFVTEAFRSLGMDVDEVFLYSIRTYKPTPIWSEFFSLLQHKEIDAIIFTSASTVNSFFEIVGDILQAGGEESSSNNFIQLDKLTKVISIGPFTSKELTKRKVKFFEAEEHSVRGTFELLLQIL